MWVWAAIDNAEGYTVEVNGQAENVTATEITRLLLLANTLSV